MNLQRNMNNKGNSNFDLLLLLNMLLPVVCAYMLMQLVWLACLQLCTPLFWVLVVLESHQDHPAAP